MSPTSTYNPAHRKRCVNVYWKRGRRVRILHPAFGYGNKKGEIINVDDQYVYVRVIFSKKPGDHDEVAYLPEQLRLI